jgi:hypothetical protein
VIDAFSISYVTEPVRADDDARVQHHAVAERDIVIQDDVPVQFAVAPDCHEIAHLRALVYPCAVAYERAVPDRGVRGYVDTFADARAGRDIRRRVDVGRAPAPATRVQDFSREREGELRL